MAKIFKNNSEKEEMGKFIEWIDSGYDSITNYNKFFEELNSVDQVIIELFEQCRTDDNGNKCDPGEIFKTMIPSIMNEDIDLKDSDLMKLFKRTDKGIHEVISDSKADESVSDSDSKKNSKKKQPLVKGKLQQMVDDNANADTSSLLKNNTVVDDLNEMDKKANDNKCDKSEGKPNKKKNYFKGLDINPGFLLTDIL